MTEREYQNLIITGDLTKLSQTYNIDDLVRYKYLNKYLIEYLLEKNIHTTIMDSHAKYKPVWMEFYLKYNILKPLLNSQLVPLLTKSGDVTLLEKLLQKLDETDRIILYHNLKNTSYGYFRDKEDEIIGIFQKFGIDISKVFAKRPTIIDKKDVSVNFDDLEKEFREVFHDMDKYSQDIYLNELRRQKRINPKRFHRDFKLLIKYKKEHPNFHLTLEKDSEGEYNPSTDTISISPYRSGVFSHELSHMMYDNFEADEKDYLAYEKIRKEINNQKTIDRIIKYLKEFHQRYDFMKKKFDELYYHEIKKQYGSFDKYIKKISEDVIENHPEFIEFHDGAVGIFYSEDNLEDVISEILYVEKEEYVKLSLRDYYTEELMLENLLDALLMGGLFDGLYKINCLSGHSGFDFLEEDELSFNECLANYDAIKKSRKNIKLINDLRELIGDELVDFLNVYLEKKRGGRRANR